MAWRWKESWRAFVRDRTALETAFAEDRMRDRRVRAVLLDRCMAAVRRNGGIEYEDVAVASDSDDDSEGDDILDAQWVGCPRRPRATSPYCDRHRDNGDLVREMRCGCYACLTGKAGDDAAAAAADAHQGGDWDGEANRLPEAPRTHCDRCWCRACVCEGRRMTGRYSDTVRTRPCADQERCCNAMRARGNDDDAEVEKG